MTHNIIYGNTIDIHGDSLKIAAPLSFASESDDNYNIYMGDGAGQSATGTGNVGIGTAALSGPYIGNNSVVIGAEAGRDLIAGDNTFIGQRAGVTVTTGHSGISIGSTAAASNNGHSSVSIGNNTLLNTTDSDQSVTIGHAAGGGITTGDRAVIIGYAAGSVGPTVANDVIYIASPGIASDISGTIRIGTGTQTVTYLAGVNGRTTAGAAVAVLVDSAGQLGTTSSNEILKRDFKPLEDDVVKEMLHETPVREYYYKAGHQAKNIGPNVEDLKTLQSWQKNFPDFIVHNENGDPYAFATHHLPWLMLHDMQRMQREFDALKGVESKKPDYSLKRTREPESEDPKKKVRMQ